MPKVICLCGCSLCAFSSSNVISLVICELFSLMLILMTSVFIMILLCHQCPKYQWRVYFLMFCNWWLLLCIAVWHCECRVEWCSHKPSGMYWLDRYTRLTDPPPPTLTTCCLLAHSFPYCAVCRSSHLCCSVLVSFCCEPLFCLPWVNLTLQDKEVAIMHFPDWHNIRQSLGAIGTSCISPGFSVLDFEAYELRTYPRSWIVTCP